MFKTQQSQRRDYSRNVYADIKLPLEPEHYRKNFLTLIQCEEQEHTRLLREKCNGLYHIKRVSKADHNFHLGENYVGYFSIQGMSPRQILYASQASKSVSIKCRNDNIHAEIAYLNEHYDVSNDALYIATNSYNTRLLERSWLHLRSKSFKIEFNVKHSYFKQLENAIQNISDNTIRRIVPSTSDFEEGLEDEWIPRSQFYRHRLDKFQMKALKTMLFCGLDAPVLVPGPFGTGKTRLLSVASEYLITRAKEEKIQARILLCCHQQKSADLFMEDYFMRMSSFDGLVVRVTSQIHHKVGKPSDHNSCCEKVPCDQFIKKFKYYQSQDRIVIVTTYLTALRMHQVIGQDYFTHILIDEGAQAREPECIAPLGMAGDETRIIIVGDSKQVGPKLVVLGDDVQKNGLGVSLLERLHETYEASIPIAKKYYTVTLRNNYRCVPGILTLPSYLFYESSLVSCSKARVVSGKLAPLEFICSSISPTATVGCESKAEAEIIIEELRKLLFHHRIHSKRICVMSSSQRQISLINKERKLNKLPWVKILSTYQMQGQEFDVLILSTVESTFSNGMPFDPLKSLCHPAVFNTAITRARSLIIVVGNPIALKRGENAIKANPGGCWKKFISTCEENGTYRVYVSQCVTQPKMPLTTTITTAYDDFAIGHHSLPSSMMASKNPTPRQPPVCSSSHNVWKTVDKPKVCSGSDATLSVSNKCPVSNKRPVSNKNPVLNKHGMNPALEFMVQKLPQLGQPTISINAPSSNSGNNVLGQQPQHKQNSNLSKIERKRNRRKAAKLRVSVKPAFVENNYSEEFPSLEDSKNMSKKDIEKQKQRSEEVIIEQKQFQHDHRQLNQKLLEEELTRLNYREKFHQLLCREEDEHEKILKERCDGIYALHLDDYSSKVCNTKYILRRAGDDYIRFGYITADHLDGDKAAYAEQASEGQLIAKFVSADGKRTELEFDMICSNIVKGSHMIVLGLEESHKSYFGMVYQKAEVTFLLKYSYFDRLHHALDHLSDGILKKLMPESPYEFGVLPKSRHSGTYMCPEVQPFVWLDDKERKSEVGGRKQTPQTFSLKTILRSDPMKAPVLLVGSFGTGKTRLLARAAYQILNNNPRANVLVCAHHQRSVDTFMDNYFGKMFENNWIIGKGTMPIRLVPSSNMYHAPCDSYQKYYKTIKEIRELPKNELKLVLTTYSSSYLLKFLKKWHFTHVLLDEGAQSREPETIIPLSLVDEKVTIVVAGDHKQVGPSILVLGDIPRKNGLKCSLLERLHKLYHEDERLKDVSDSHCATLLTNYRSHHALLSLPSYLFYGSALVTVAEASNLLHPGAPHPLKFVCSSLDDNVVEVTRNINKCEAKLILDQVLEYIHKWPMKKWGPIKENNLCIMATTPNQKTVFQREMKDYADIINTGVEVLTVYDIQGREFQAIFLSTAESITENGTSKNPTKSPCGEYVFNTAITRAKSHVICAGNPFLLMRIEKTMDNVDNEKSFWKDYFRRCIITKCFIVPSSIKHSSNLEKLQKIVFEDDSKTCHPLNSHTPSDSIMKRLEQLLATRYKVNQCKFEIQKQSQEYYSTNWELEIEDDSQSNAPFINDGASTDSLEKIICDLEIKNARRAIAIPQESQQESIVINGYHNRQGAFNGDVVEISLMGHDEEGTKYGKVVQVKEFNHPMKYVCTADHKDVIFFYPIDKKVPSIVNLPKLSRSILQHKREELNELQKEYITVFEESSLADKDLSLKIKELIPLSMGPSLLFVVKVLSWSPKFRKPLGAVIEALPRTNNLFITEKLLSIAHDIQEEDESQCEDPSPNQDENQSISPCSNDVYRNAIAIDPERAVNFDDAVTIIPLDEEFTYELAVLIIDVTEYIKKDSNLDEIAMRKGTSVYPGHQTGCKMIPMLPLDFTQSKLSLQDNGGIRPVIVVSAKVKIQADSTTGDDVIVLDRAIVKKSVLEDPVNLTYGSAAQLIMNDDSGMNTELKGKVGTFDKCNTFSLKKTLHLLFKVAMKLRMNRLNDAAYNYRISDPKEERSWQAHLLVEELMIWANSEIANYVIKERPDVGVIRCQPPPLSNELSEFCDTHRKFLSLSLSHKEILPSDDVPSDDKPLSPEPVTCKGLLVTSDVIEKLRQAYCSKNTQELVRILSQESNFPQLSIVEDALISISQRAKYTFINPSSDEIMGRPNLYSHHSIKRIYTHFSSPIRRYIDMIVHRIAKALLEKKDMPYEKKDLLELCRDLNLKTRNAKQYSKNIDRAQSSSKWEDEGMKKTVAYITTSIFKKQKFHLCFQDGQIDEFMKRDDSTFDFSHLTYHKRDSDMITWQVMSVPLNGPGYLTECPSLRAINSDDGDGQMNLQAKVYPASKDDGRCLKEHVVSIVDNNRIIPLEQWQLAQKCVTEPTQKNIDSFFMSSRLSDESTSNAVEDEQASRRFRSDATNSPLIMYSVEARLDIGYPVNVWLGKSTREPFSSPSLHMIEVSPTVRICLMHVQDPSSCFSNHQLRRTFDTDDLVEYVDVWCNALLAEACHDCVKTKTITILKGAHLNWPNLVKSDTSIDKIYYKPMESPSLEISLEKYDMMDFINIHVGDLVCARYETQQGSQEVYHFYVKRIEELDKQKDIHEHQESKYPGKMIVYFDSYGEHGCKVSEKMKKLLKDTSNPLRCDLQIIKAPISFLRVFQRLQYLKREEYSEDKNGASTPAKQRTWMELAKAVASVQCDKLRSEPVLMNEYLKVLEEDLLAKSLWETENKGKQLNTKQIEAIKSALRHRFQLIQGPPGTGKSVTGAHLAYIFAIANKKSTNRKKVLYCGPSNKAVDVVHYQLIKVNKKLPHETQKLKILRLYGRTHEAKDYPNPILEVMGLDYEEKLDSMCPEELKSYALHHKIRQKNSELKNMEEKLLSMKRNGKIPCLTERQKYKECLLESEAQEMQTSYDVILCTCNETCSTRILQACKQELNSENKPPSPLVIGQVIVDECGMAHEPETIAAISRCEHAVLIGDHMQLQPVVKHTPAKNCGLNKSLFQRYAEHEDIDRQCCLITLDIQYRMHEYICQAPSTMFYDGNLQPADSVKMRKPLGRLNDFFKPGYPVRFFDIEGKEESGMADDSVSFKTSVDVHSKFNISEAKKAVELIREIRALVRDSPKEASIAVLTPYAAQKDTIDKLLKKNNIHRVKVLSIVESQGDEYDVVIISTVRTLPRKQIRVKKYVQPDRKWRTENLGFLIDSHQLNVAITRAKHGLIIIGNRMLLEYDEDGWGKLIEIYHKDGVIVRED